MISPRHTQAWTGDNPMLRGIHLSLAIFFGIVLAATVAGAQCPLNNGLWGSAWTGAYPGAPPWSGFVPGGYGCPFSSGFVYPWSGVYPGAAFPTTPPRLTDDLNRELTELRQEIAQITEAQKPDPAAMKDLLARTLKVLDQLSGPATGTPPSYQITPPWPYYYSSPYGGRVTPSDWMSGRLAPPGYWFRAPGPPMASPDSPPEDSASPAGQN